jgi:SAM-dependent methyltransferase
MEIFKKYATFYDAIYEGKNYRAECDFIESIWNKKSDRSVKSVLDIGCGTGSHAITLAERGYQVSAIDQSEEMIAVAKEKAQQKRCEFALEQKDIRNFDLGRQFDCVISLFAVMSYMISNKDVIDAMLCVRKHLKPGGIFIFDVWYGPAVLHLLPSDRVKEFKRNDEIIYRIAQSDLDHLKQNIIVNYTLINSHTSEVIKESHKLRFFFLQELKLLAGIVEMEFIDCFPFLSIDKKPSFDSWNVTCIFRS